MNWPIVTVLAAHVLASVFWAGSTFTLARLGGTAAERLFRPQLFAAAVAIVSGAYLWKTLHEGAPSRTELVLGVAAIAGMLAVLVQALGAGPALRQIGRGAADAAAARVRMARVHSIAAAMLLVAVIGMAVARYAA